MGGVISRLRRFAAKTSIAFSCAWRVSSLRISFARDGARSRFQASLSASKISSGQALRARRIGWPEFPVPFPPYLH
jgi:hypothetical protein